MSKPATTPTRWRAGTQINLRAGVALDALLRARAGPCRSLTEVARRDLERYYTLAADELRRLTLSEDEALLLCAACRDTAFAPQSLPLLWAIVTDAIRLEGLDRAFGVDGDALLARLRALSPLQTAAVVDAIERFWLTPSQDSGRLVREVGLVRKPNSGQQGA